MAKLIVVAVILLSLADANAATYFVDFVGGNDANSGLTRETPWKRLPGMDNERVAPSLSSGDIVCFKGGSSWIDRLIATSGVTYRGDCISWGSGRAQISTPAVARATAAFLCLSCDNVTVVAFEFSNESRTADYQGAAYIEGTDIDPVTNFRAENCVFSNSGQGVMIRKNTDGATLVNVEAFNNTYPASLDPANSSGILVAGPNTRNITITKALVHNNGVTVLARGRNEGRGLTISGGATAVYIENVFSYANGSLDGEEGSALEIGNASYVTITHSRFEGATAAELKNRANYLTIDNNFFKGTSSGVFQYGFYAGNDSVGSTISNNVFISTRNLRNAAVKLSSPGTTTRFENNFILLPPDHAASAIEFNTAGTFWSMESWNGHLDGNLVTGGRTYSIEVTSGRQFIMRSLEQHQSAYPLQAVTDRVINGK
jgi:hypothetical protein